MALHVSKGAKGNVLGDACVAAAAHDAATWLACLCRHCLPTPTSSHAAATSPKRLLLRCDDQGRAPRRGACPAPAALPARCTAVRKHGQAVSWLPGRLALLAGGLGRQHTRARASPRSPLPTLPRCAAPAAPAAQEILFAPESDYGHRPDGTLLLYGYVDTAGEPLLASTDVPAGYDARLHADPYDGAPLVDLPRSACERLRGPPCPACLLCKGCPTVGRSGFGRWRAPTCLLPACIPGARPLPAAARCTLLARPSAGPAAAVAALPRRCRPVQPAHQLGGAAPVGRAAQDAAVHGAGGCSAAGVGRLHRWVLQGRVFAARREVVCSAAPCQPAGRLPERCAAHHLRPEPTQRPAPPPPSLLPAAPSPASHDPHPAPALPPSPLPAHCQTGATA